MRGQMNLMNMSYGGPDKLNGRYKDPGVPLLTTEARRARRKYRPFGSLSLPCVSPWCSFSIGPLASVGTYWNPSEP
jgi:hypothetical protein